MKRKHFIHGWQNARVLLSDERIRILNFLKDAPLSLSRLAELLELNPGSVHNHLKKLLAIGAIEEIAAPAQTQRGAPSKYFRAVAEEILIGDLSADDLAAKNTAIAKRVQKDVHVILENNGLARRYDGYLTKEQYQKLKRTLDELADEFASTEATNKKLYRFIYSTGPLS